jgi:uroporphyrin-III C-methyltransferase/precorrin-2 dehydrogenase/sirohydrochlorin ferrochelatase
MTTYPVSLDLGGRACVVLGGDELAAERARGLLEAGASVTVIAAEAGAGVEALAADGSVRLVRRRYRPGDLAAAWLAIDASGDERVNAAAHAEAEASRVLLNVVDRPARCHFIAPAIVRRPPLQVAITTDGESPFLAGALRARLEQDLGPEWGPFTALVGRVRRALRRRGVDLAEQTREYRRLLAERVAGRASGAGWVALVGAGPGDPGLLTLAGRELLGVADAVFHDALVSPEILSRCAPWARLVDVGKRGGGHGRAQPEITAALIEAARRGEHAVRLKGGDPLVFGRGGEELEALTEADVEVIVVPGVSAALGAPAAAGVPLTRRGVAGSVGIVSGHAASSGVVPESVVRVAGSVDTLVVLMPLKNLDALAGALAPAVGASRPAALVVDASRPGERVIRAPLASLPEEARRQGARSPATLLVGDVVNRGRAAELAAAASFDGGPPAFP